MDVMEIDDVMDVDIIDSNTVVSQKIIADESHRIDSRSTETCFPSISDRNSFQNEEDIFPVNRNILKAKRRTMTIPRSVTMVPEKLIVIDTNIFINRLNDLKIIFAHLSRNHKNCVTFVVPMIVLQELDGLKKNSAVNVQRAITFINEELESNSMLFSDVTLIKKYRESSRMEVKNQQNEDIDIYNNDDIIIEKCLLLKKFKDSDRFQVTLLTDDVNLQNKALAVGLRFYSWKKLKAEFLPPKTCDSEVSSSQESLSLQTSLKKRKISGDQSGKSVQKMVKEIPANHAKLKNQHVEIKQNAVSKECVTKKYKETENVDWLTLKYESEKKLSDFIESSLKREYGDKLWDKMFNVNLKSASLLDLLRLLKQGWIGVFSDSFDRNPKVQELVHELLNSLRENSSQEKLKTQLFALMKHVPSLKPKCNDNINVAIKKRKTF